MKEGFSNTFSTKYEEYIDFCEKVLYRSPHTVHGMRSTKTLFLEYLPDQAVESYTLDDIIRFQYYLSCRPGNGGHYKKSTVGMRLSKIKVFFKWCEQQGYDVLNWEMIIVPQNKLYKIEFLTHDEYLYLMSGICTNYLSGLRLRAICEVLFSTGCRVSELLNMKIADIDFKHHEIVVKRKGGSIGVVFLNYKAELWLQRYLKRRCSTNPYLWVNNKCERLSQHTLRSQMDNLGQKMKMTKKIHPHLFRHTFATTLLRNGANIRECQELLGHSSLESTMIYTHVTNQDLRKAHSRFLRV